MAVQICYATASWKSKFAQFAASTSAVMLTYAEGMKLVQHRCRAIADSEQVELAEARGRIFAEDLYSPVGYPLNCP